MKNPKLIFAIVLGVVFCFAGYNLWSYFKEQQAIQLEEDGQAEQARLDSEKRREERLAAEEAERVRLAAEAEAEKLERERQAEQERLAREAEAEARREEAERLRAEQDAARLAERVRKARSLRHIEGIEGELLERLLQLSPRYVRDHPEEFQGQTLSAGKLGLGSQFTKLLHEGSSPLMLYAAISPDRDLLQAFLDIGLDLNAANKAGYTPLMFAAAYNKGEVASFLVGQGADIEHRAYVQELSPLHVASLFNPDPSAVSALIAVGSDIEATTSNGYTAIMLAASDNQNLEVVSALLDAGASHSQETATGETAAKLLAARLEGSGDRYYSLGKEADQAILRRLSEE